ncbi:MAG: tyrosine-type recombinase/integrase, partial [Candidatus Eremiobacteraeota bacterium]|nr:tyrosine-type recombinase/integrase [Candidatus Eremiobacteraeota bacterium]
MEVLYATGIRRFELLNLEISALRLAEEMVHILGKGQKERVVPLGTSAKVALERYLSEGRPHLVEGSHHHVFVSQHHGGPVSEEELLQAIRRHARRAEISQVTGFHQFRYTCATHLLRGGADLRCIQTLLGHSQLSTTAIYTKVEVADLKKTLRECHPREKIPIEGLPDSWPLEARQLYLQFAEKLHQKIRYAGQYLKALNQFLIFQHCQGFSFREVPEAFCVPCPGTSRLRQNL